MNPEEERFFAKVDRSGDCWLWTGARTPRGYGTFHYGGVPLYAHRFVYEQVHGGITDGLHIDHLCRTTSCVRPDHLELVTAQTNILRGVGATARNARKTECPKGHAYDDANVYRSPSFPDRRYCRACMKGRPR